MKYRSTSGQDQAVIKSKLHGLLLVDSLNHLLSVDIHTLLKIFIILTKRRQVETKFKAVHS